MRLILVPLVLAAITLSSAATSRKSKVPAAVPDGKPIQCLSLTQIRNSNVRSDSVIDFVTTGGKVYRNTLDYPCPSLGFEQRFEHKTSISQICSAGTITVLREGPGLQRGATCGLGQFQPVRLVKASKKQG